MSYPIIGLHHVTATVDAAQPDLDFCIETLGLRLVKKTVNFDNHHVYHFYYGDERSTPGTIWTTFPYKGRGVAVGTKGVGQVVVTSFSVPRGSLPFWTARLQERGVRCRTAANRFGEQSLSVSDPSGLAFELIATDRDARNPWTSNGVAADAAIRGLHSVTIDVAAPRPTVELMTDVLGFTIVNEEAGRIRLAVNGGQPGRAIDVAHGTDAPPAVNGLGTVHHVALAILDPDDQRRLREELIERGLKVTEIRDRQYFQSIYFREPGGVLFEVATVGPGFTFDEELPWLGRDLKLPPWEEPSRQEIEAGLPAVRHR